MKTTDGSRRAIAANRFGLGARPGELEAVGSDPAGWLTAQLGRRRPLPGELADVRPSHEQLAATQAMFAERQRERRKLERTSESERRSLVRSKRRDFRMAQQKSYVAGAAARTLAAVNSSEPFRERLVHFWSNHFTVSVLGEPLLAGAAVSFENEAIRPYVAGRFVDMLLAVETHPVMLIYLDNHTSIGPRSMAARRSRGRGRRRGLNENLAREILELHTLGVDGGYTQEDVTTFAKVITGWTVGRDGRRLGGAKPGRFAFLAPAHEPGRKQVLGRSYADAGFEQGVAVLRDLASHPSTARFIATKLARHFVADDPPGPVVDRLARVFRETEGDLARVSAQLVAAPEAWRQPASKLKTPQELVVSGYRAIGARAAPQRELLGSLALLNQRPFSAPSPAGWGDTAASWDGADALLKRIEWGAAFGARHRQGPSPEEIIRSALGPLASARTDTAVSRAQSRRQGLALLLCSPEFQRR